VEHQPGRRLGRGGAGAGAGEELLDRDAVEAGELGELLDRDGPVAAFVRADDHGLPAALGLLFDSVQRQTLLLPDGPQASTELLAVLLRHICGLHRSGYGCCSTPFRYAE